MSTLELLQQIFEVCIIPLLGILTSFIVVYVRKKIEELKQTTNNELCQKYMDMLQTTVIDCVLATNQTYVENLKKKNVFTKEAQETAFKNTYNTVMEILAEDAKNYLTNIFDDFNLYVQTLIEAEVNNNKDFILNN